MYKIVKDGETVAMTEAPNYIRMAGNGCRALCSAEEAEGIAYGGQVFHLLGRPKFIMSDLICIYAASYAISGMNK